MIDDAHPTTATPRTSKRDCGIATVAILAFLAIGPSARALTLTGPTDTPPGGATCSPSDAEPNGTSLTWTCTVSNPGAFTDLYFGLANNATINGMEMNGTMLSSGEIFRYSSSTAQSFSYTGTTTIENLVSGSAENVNTRLVLTLTAGSGIVIDTAGNPANNN